jgi:hypothetical protein
MKLIRPINIASLLLLCAVTLFSCTVGQLYTYDIRLERPVLSKNLQFENDTMSITFVFEPEHIYFNLFNKLDDAIKINWKDISVSIDGETKRVIPSYAYNVGFHGKEQTIMVAPRSKIGDIIRTTDKINFSDTSTVPNCILNTYPQSDGNQPANREYILSLKGKRIVIYMPFYLKNMYCSKTFEFVVADVIALPPPPKKTPAK